MHLRTHLPDAFFVHAPAVHLQPDGIVRKMMDSLMEPHRAQAALEKRK